MGWLSELAKGLVQGFIEAVNRPAPAKPWRWGHMFVREDNMCGYCKRFIPGKVRDTKMPCTGPTHDPTPDELGR